MTESHPRRRTGAPPGAASVAGLALVAAALAGCAPSGPDGRAGATPTSSAPAAHGSAHPAPRDALPSDHVHGVAVNPADGLVYLATHDGLFRYGPAGPERVGPVIDLMGFTVAGPDHFFSSGHPGPGVDLPQPLGLAESTDGGATWTSLSRGGQSDFHALTASSAGVVGYDGLALRSSEDGRSWTDLEVPVPPFALATSPAGEVVLLTSPDGMHRSADGGRSWERPEAPLLQHVAFADETVVLGVTPEGAVARSDDAGVTWTGVGDLDGPATALTATAGDDGHARVVAVTPQGVRESRDGGATFAPLGSG